MVDLPLPIEFCSEIIGPVLRTLTAGESCSLVGVAASGKSNVARHLARLDVREHHLGEYARKTLCVYADCMKLSDYSIASLHGLVLEAMLHATEEASPAMAALRPELKKLWEQTAGVTAPDRVRRALEEAVTSVLQVEGTQVFVILDDFDHVVRQAPAPTLNRLRALRDDHKSRLMYVTVTRRELAFLRDQDEFQDFYEIVTSTTIPIGPYREADANFMIERLSRRWPMPQRPTEAERQKLLEASGGHPGLLRTIFRAAQQGEIVLLSPNLIETLRGHKDVEPECAKIWESLEEEEKTDLIALASQGYPTGEGTRPLERKGLIWRRLDGTYDIFSPVMADFIRGERPEGRVIIGLLPERRQIEVDGRAFNNLDRVEYHLFKCLFTQRGKPVASYELIKEMILAEVNQRRFPGPPEQRLDAYMAELKHKIDTATQKYIIREPDASYRLVGTDGK